MTKMTTIEEVVTQLKSIDVRWQALSNGTIRTATIITHCPLEALNWYKGVRYIDRIDQTLRRDIIAAADHSFGHNRHVRAALMTLGNGGAVVSKKPNHYQQLIDPTFYERTPKAVFAALAVSPLWQRIDAEGPDAPGLEELLREEWRILQCARHRPTTATQGDAMTRAKNAGTCKCGSKLTRSGTCSTCKKTPQDCKCGPKVLRDLLRF